MNHRNMNVLVLCAAGLLAGLTGLQEASGQAGGDPPSLCLDTKLISDDLSERDSFGKVVSTDGSVAAVATGTNTVAANREIVYVFRRQASGWVQEARIATPVEVIDNVREFGKDVAISGDVLVIGALGQSAGGGGGDAPGRAFVYRYFPDDGQWRLEDVLRSVDETGRSSRLFGITVAINDSGNRIAIGSEGGINLFYRVLLATVFRHAEGGDWIQEARLPISSVAEEISVWNPANWLDLTDEYLIGGSPHSSNSPLINGDEAFIYRLDQADSTWHHEAHLLPPVGESESFFGFGVSVHGDVAATVAINATDLNGAVYVYRRRADGNWIEEAILGGPPQGNFDLDVDVQENMIFVSGSRGTSDGSSRSVVFVYRFDGGQWNLDVTALGDGLGNLAGGFAKRIDAGGGVLIAAGRHDRANFRGAGAAYIFAGTDGNDCNENGITDACDLLATISFDDNANGIPDECEPPTCEGLTATVYVDQFGVIVGGLLSGIRYFGLLIGTRGDDVIVGTENSDLIIGWRGNDVICGAGGHDHIIFPRHGRSRRDQNKPLRIQTNRK